ncbi:metallophosphoesterase [Thermococcus sp. AM4]|uniref:metallophosphoesterase n=1 Tax=Thermococcus sp. (strain AM4) TaxID=246969 RepID=UPI000186FA47|nr:metallophosphoesterase [Thermococcus sp. AM4]EEB75053.1 hypothetical protein TAM4_998 [Thermococcus sp. AM4]
MGISPFSFNDLSLELRTSRGKTLLLADLHIGFEFSRGLRIRTRFEELLAGFIVEKDPDLLILLGDVKEPLGLSFGLKKILMEFFSELKGIPTIITKGNHDGRIEDAVGAFRDVRVVQYFTLDGMLFLHGHTQLPEGEFREVYLGHIHPAYVFKDRGVRRKVKVFARVGSYLVLPTVNPYIEGFPIEEGLRMVPFLKDVEYVDVFLPEGIYLGKIRMK